jgi:hypothetical protein
MCIFTFHATHPRATLQAFDLAPIATIIAEMPLWRASSWRGSDVRGSVRERGRRKQSVELGLADGRWHRVVYGQERVVIEVHTRGRLICRYRRRRGRSRLRGCRRHGGHGARPSQRLSCQAGRCRRGPRQRCLQSQRELSFLIVEPVLDLALVLYDSPGILRLRDGYEPWSALPCSPLRTVQMRTRLSGDRDALLRVVVPIQLCYAPCDCRLLSRAKLIFAALVGVGGGALFVLRVDGDLRGVVAGVNYVCPAWRNGSR